MSSNFSEASVSFPQPTPLRPISLPLLMLQGGELRLEVHQPFPELEDSEPVQGWIQLRHRGSCLEVEGEASTQVLCRCDRCLRPFHLPLRTQAHELLAVGPVGAAEGQADLNAELLQDSWLNENGRVDLEALLGEDPEERLDPQGAFDPEH